MKWNFTKFLVDKHGTPIKRYGPSTQPLRITKDIEKLLLQTYELKYSMFNLII